MKINAYTLEKNNNAINLVCDKAIKYDYKGALNSPQKVSDFIKELFRTDNQLEEHFYILSIDNKGKLLGVFDAFHGSATSSIVDVRGVILRILLSGGLHCIVAHNHPSGTTNPSPNDIDITKKLKGACELMGLSLLDHLILASDGYFSFKNNGLI